MPFEAVAAPEQLASELASLALSGIQLPHPPMTMHGSTRLIRNRMDTLVADGSSEVDN